MKNEKLTITEHIHRYLITRKTPATTNQIVNAVRRRKEDIRGDTVTRMLRYMAVNNVINRGGRKGRFMTWSV